MTNDKGRAVPNQFIIYDDYPMNSTEQKTFFQSYNSIIAYTQYPVGKRKVVLDKNFWNYSKTTSKWLGYFLGHTAKETRERVKSGEYEMQDLNS